MTYFAVFYEYNDDAAAQDRIRPEHRAFLRSLDEIVASGPLPERTPAGALLIMRAASQQALADILDRDPFWEAQLIARRDIQLWNPVIGVFAD